MCSGIFLDTSSLIKMYHEESGSLESSALMKHVKLRQSKLSSKACKGLIELFQSEANFEFVLDDSAVKEIASELISTYWQQGLRTLDSLQLSSALQVKDRLSLFIISDRSFCDVAKHNGFDVKTFI